MLIGIGFGRIGTLSLRAALYELGFGPCHHMIDVTGDPDLEARWHRKARSDDISWDEILGGFASIVDWPGCYYWRELLDHYPQAKAVLTVRDAGAWYGSAAETIYALAQASQPQSPGQADGLSDLVIWRGTFGGRFAERDHAMQVFAEHHRQVISTVHPRRLLVYDIRDGWGPLCDFLGTEAPPGTSFPHRNDRASFPARWQPGSG